MRAKFFSILHFERSLIKLILLAAISVACQQCDRPLYYKKYSERKEYDFKSKEKINAYSPEFFKSWSKKFVKVSDVVDPSGVVSGIFLGDDSKINSKIKEEFKAAGIYHLLAASGFNCWIVAYLFVLVSGVILHFFWFTIPVKTLLWLRQYLNPLAALVGAWIFFFWSDGSAPIVRSVFTISTKSILELIWIRCSGLRFLLVSYLFFLILNPSNFSSASFELTYFCLFGIGLSAKIFRKIEIKNRIINFIYQNASASIGASLGSAPITWIFFSQINFTSMFTNFFAIPIASIFVMPFSLLVMLVVPFSTRIAQNLAIFPHYSSELLLFLVRWYNEVGIHISYVD